MVWLLGLGLGCNGALDGKDDPDVEPGTPAEELQRGCESGTAKDCRLLAGLHMLGNGVELNMERAAELYSQACGGGDADACASLATMHFDGTGQPRDLQRAADLYGKACEGGAVEACAQLADMHLEAMGVAEDVGKAIALSKQACEGGRGESCSALSAMYGLGARVPRNPTESRRYAKRGCDVEHVPSCFQLAERQILEDDDRDARSLLEALAGKHAESDDIDRVALYGLMVAAGEKPSKIGAPLLSAWKATESSDWSWAALTDHLRNDKKKKAKESRIVIELLSAPHSDGTESALRAALEVPE